MQQIKRWSLIFGLFVLSMAAAVAKAAPNFIEGKDYKVITAKVSSQKNSPVKVMEFFSYGCPGCYQFEPVIEAWLSQKPKGVDFEKVPVIFHQGWDVYARAFYVAKSLGILNKMNMPLFTAIHRQNQPLNDEQSMADFFAKQGVNRQTFIAQYEFMPLIGVQLAKSEQLMRAYSIYEIPTIVIGEKYKTSISMVNGDVKKFIALLNYLVERARGH